MKRIWKIVMICICLWAMSLNASAQKQLIIDDADLLTQQEEQQLQDALSTISDEYQMDVVIVTNYSLDGKTSQAFADDYFDYNGYGQGNDHDGILLLVSMEYRDWAISTCGKGIEVFTDAGLDYLEDQFLDELSSGNYYEAFDKFTLTCEKFMQQAKEGKPYDNGNMPKGELGSVWIFLAIGIGLVIGATCVYVMYNDLNSARPQKGAFDYTIPGSMKITKSKDIFLYRHVTRRAKPKQSSGSSTHISSSGRSHGGSSGKF
ncbi:MAG: TPM domain-containing protein [Erysipelotrichaceae bacterium]|nr:TPM domain-containing protein [Erysipelotrichaceae bacterium]MDY5252424.1 TPM domain-containing protein [Erysipelotrichaceae bacterium]